MANMLQCDYPVACADYYAAPGEIEVMLSDPCPDPGLPHVRPAGFSLTLPVADEDFLP
jgi:hypothetical protein